MENKLPKFLSYERRTILNYKIKLPEVKGKCEALLNTDNKHYYVGGDVWVCLWFRKGKMGNQISLEYNRFSGEKCGENFSNGGSVGKYFVESYLPIELIPFVMKCFKIFQKIIGKYENEYKTTINEFSNFIKKEFGGEENGK